MSEFAAIILAAGKGTRMKSKLPKVLHKLSGKPMLEHVLDAAGEAGVDDEIVIVGFGSEKVTEFLGTRARVAIQKEQLGTGHAVLQARDLLGGEKGTALILCGDTPLMRRTLKAVPASVSLRQTPPIPSAMAAFCVTV